MMTAMISSPPSTSGSSSEVTSDTTPISATSASTPISATSASTPTSTTSETRDKSSRKVHKCPYNGCNYSSTHFSSVRQHLAYIHDEGVRWFSCDLCEYKAKKNSTVRRHKADVHSIDVVWYPCTIEGCSYRAKQKSHMKRHVHVVHVQKKVAEWKFCSSCAFRTKSQKRLDIHMEQHKREMTKQLGSQTFASKSFDNSNDETSRLIREGADKLMQLLAEERKASSSRQLQQRPLETSNGEAQMSRAETEEKQKLVEPPVGESGGAQPASVEVVKQCPKSHEKEESRGSPPPAQQTIPHSMVDTPQQQEPCASLQPPMHCMVPQSYCVPSNHIMIVQGPRMAVPMAAHYAGGMYQPPPVRWVSYY